MLQLLLSIGLGFLIGLERERQGKSVGIRTVSLITLGSTLFCLMSPIAEDNSRIVAQIISGLGFLGAGIIFKSENRVHGLTTAATIWASAAIGCLVGMYEYTLAIEGTLCIIFINFIFKYLKHDK